MAEEGAPPVGQRPARVAKLVSCAEHTGPTLGRKAEKNGATPASALTGAVAHGADGDDDHANNSADDHHFAQIVVPSIHRGE